ncbi:histidine phosphatase family protein [Streptomyces sp. NPDC054940]
MNSSGPAAASPSCYARTCRSLPLPDRVAGIVASPVPRAHQTASEVAHLTGLPITTTDLLAEWRAPSIVLGHAPDTYPPTYRA